MTISVKDLLFRIFLRWRIIIVAMFIGGVLLNIFGSVMTHQAIGVNIKDTFTGCIMGAMCICGYIVIGYIMTKKLRVTGDITEGFKISVLGSFRAIGRKKQFLGEIDQRLIKLFKRQSCDLFDKGRIDMLCTEVVLTAQKLDMKKVCLTGTCRDKDIKILKKIFAERLQTDIDEVVCVDPKSIAKELIQYEGVVLFERVDVSDYKNISKLVEQCSQYNIPIIGGVVIE